MLPKRWLVSVTISLIGLLAQVYYVSISYFRYQSSTQIFIFRHEYVRLSNILYCIRMEGGAYNVKLENKTIKQLFELYDDLNDNIIAAQYLKDEYFMFNKSNWSDTFHS